jgi:hypothetical protein
MKYADAPTLPAVNDDLLHTLPPVLRAVVRALGFVRAYEWLHAFGGVRITLPLHKTSALDLTDAELQAMRHTLAPHLNTDGRFWAPKVDKIMIQLRDEQIRKERHSTSIRVLARRYRLSSRHVLNICREDGSVRQSVLF